jgi:hypothetical protein
LQFDRGDGKTLALSPADEAGSRLSLPAGATRVVSVFDPFLARFAAMDDFIGGPLFYVLGIVVLLVLGGLFMYQRNKRSED